MWKYLSEGSASKIYISCDNLYIKKEYRDEIDWKMTGEIDEIITREKDIFKLLSGKKNFPTILEESPNCLIMNYCGEEINKDNIPENWEEQLDNIMSTLKDNNIVYLDGKQENILVKDGTIYLIDFGASYIIGKHEIYSWMQRASTNWKGDVKTVFQNILQDVPKKIFPYVKEPSVKLGIVYKI